MYSTRTRADAEWVFHEPKNVQIPVIFTTICRKPTAQERLKRLFCEKCPSVWICFCGGCLDSGNVTNVLDRILCGYSWWASVTRFLSQGSSPDDLGSPSVQILAGFPESLVLPFPYFPIHKVNQESCNYGVSERAESCAELSSSQQVGSVFSPQKTVSFPLLSRPIILAVYERISLYPSAPPNTHITQPETFYYPYFGTRSACSSILGLFFIFLLSQLTVTSEAGATCSFRLQKTCVVFCLVTITHWERN